MKMKTIQTEKRIDIRQWDLVKIEDFLKEKGEKPFRAKQIQQWLWQKSAHSFEEMTNLSLSLRELLNQYFVIQPISIDQAQNSEDGTIKTAFRLHDKHLIEGVLIPADDRMTACVSSQVGCSLTCKFCATGYMPRKRNLEAGEIYDQVIAISEQAEEFFEQPLSNIVYMGMGEPLLNYKNVLESIHYITSPQGLNMASRRITVSTAGIAKMIKKLGDDEVKFNLALSLHAANDLKRNEIMPINEQNALNSLIDALQYFYKKTHSRLTLEYIIFKDFNDSLEDAEELYQFTRKVPCKINIIEYNPIQEADFKNVEEEKLFAFENYLKERGVIINVRRSRGKDIDAACGQLAIKEKG